MFKNAIILMTALLPTTGHADLINFAKNMPNTKVHVLINSRSFEPYGSLNRWQDLHDHFRNYPNIIIRHSIIDDAPQYPDDMPIGFWEWWRDEINKKFPKVDNNWDYVIASETYGQNVADALGADFIPYDIDRNFNNARGETARKDPWNNWDMILDTTRKNFQIKCVMFGQESVGKTTISKLVAEKLQVKWLPEFARPYLETVGEEVTLEKMSHIFAGQLSIQKNAIEKAETPALIMDTDLFSTVGYYPIMGFDAPVKKVIEASYHKNDIYYVMPDTDVTFVPDTLRYGGDKRESSMNYWIDLLENYNLNYKVVPIGSIEEKVDWIVHDIQELFNNRFSALQKFERERENS